MLPSFAMVGRNDVVLSSHNTLMFGGGWFYFGGYGGFATISENVTDTSFGGAVRFGEKQYLEMQGGYFERKFTQNSQKLKGKGFSANLIYGAHLTDNFGLSVILSGKRIASGDLDKRWIYDLLPFLSLRAEY